MSGARWPKPKIVFAGRSVSIPDHANATLNLGATQQLRDQVEEAEGLFRKALELGVDVAQAKSNLALALMEQVRPEEAELCCREALASAARLSRGARQPGIGAADDGAARGGMARI